MIRVVVLAVFLVTSMGGSALAAEPIVGNWRTQTGSIAAIAPCGGSFCITLRSTKHVGNSIGTMASAGGSLTLSGCVLGTFYRSQTWSRWRRT